MKIGQTVKLKSVGDSPEWDNKRAVIIAFVPHLVVVNLLDPVEDFSGDIREGTVWFLDESLTTVAAASYRRRNEGSNTAYIATDDLIFIPTPVNIQFKLPKIHE